MESSQEITLLVVDDDPSVRSLLFAILTRHGYSVIEAAGAAEGIKLFSSYGRQIDLILTDITMPDLDGVSMVEEIRGRQFDGPVLFMSGRGDTLPARTSDNCSFLLKPFRIPDLLGALQTCLNAIPAKAECA
jgi:two-component system cell cycle sensor histidine kinase/response regulator CckA